MSIAINKNVVDMIHHLRLNDGLSIGKIQSKLGLGKATVSKYVRGLRPNNKNFIPRERRVLASSTYSALWEGRRAKVRQSAIEQWQVIKLDPILLGMIALYWGEGTKRKRGHTGQFIICNSDPGIIKATMTALEKLGYNNFSLELRIYEGQDKLDCKNNWESMIYHPINYVRVQNHRNKNTKLYSKYGVCALKVCKSFVLYHTIIQWIDCWRNDLGISEHYQL